ncbi:MAG TPA: SgcJ/EcaC family oxidoreductase [Casimicrobiaceae bacterium]|nr:SgcJ/EcaC family oxidoreductase [Casimicrobiaceae bacterium]
MSARTPEDLHPLFARHFAAADMAGLLSLYEPDAVLLPQPGAVARGHAAIRDALNAFLAMKGTFAIASSKTVHAGDIALAYVKWTLDAKGPDGAPIHLEGETSDVLRRQADGRWLIVIDSPFGAAGAA